MLLCRFLRSSVRYFVEVQLQHFILPLACLTALTFSSGKLTVSCQSLESTVLLCPVKKKRVISEGDARIFVVYWIYGVHYFCTQCNYIHTTCCLSRSRLQSFSAALQMSALAMASQKNLLDKGWVVCYKTCALKVKATEMTQTTSSQKLS